MHLIKLTATHSPSPLGAIEIFTTGILLLLKYILEESLHIILHLLVITRGSDGLIY